MSSPSLSARTSHSTCSRDTPNIPHLAEQRPDAQLRWPLPRTSVEGKQAGLSRRIAFPYDCGCQQCVGWCSWRCAILGPRSPSITTRNQLSAGVTCLRLRIVPRQIDFPFKTMASSNLARDPSRPLRRRRRFRRWRRNVFPGLAVDRRILDATFPLHQIGLHFHLLIW